MNDTERAKAIARFDFRRVDRFYVRGYNRFQLSATMFEAGKLVEISIGCSTFSLADWRKYLDENLYRVIPCIDSLTRSSDTLENACVDCSNNLKPFLTDDRTIPQAIEALYASLRIDFETFVSLVEAEFTDRPPETY